MIVPERKYILWLSQVKAAIGHRTYWFIFCEAELKYPGSKKIKQEVLEKNLIYWSDSTQALNFVSMKFMPKSDIKKKKITASLLQSVWTWVGPAPSCPNHWLHLSLSVSYLMWPLVLLLLVIIYTFDYRLTLLK